MLNKNDKNIEWFAKAKLGLFIHWGLYSATDGYWNGKETPGIVEWIASRSISRRRNMKSLRTK